MKSKVETAAMRYECGADTEIIRRTSGAIL